MTDALQQLNQAIREHGEPANVIHTDARGKALWDALAPLVAAGTLTDDEQLMLLVCLTWGKYPVTGRDMLRRNRASEPAAEGSSESEEPQP